MCLKLCKALYRTKSSVTASAHQTGDRERCSPQFLALLCGHDSDIDLHEVITSSAIFRLLPPACYAADHLGLNILISFFWYGDPVDILVFFNVFFQLWLKKLLVSLLTSLLVDFDLTLFKYLQLWNKTQCSYRKLINHCHQEHYYYFY